MKLNIDESLQLTAGKLPSCASVDVLLDPIYLLFNDWDWLENRSNRQEKQFREWKNSVKDKTVVIIELGSGVSGCFRVFQGVLRVVKVSDHWGN